MEWARARVRVDALPTLDDKPAAARVSVNRASRHLARQALWLLDGNMVRPRAGVDAGDHPPITPMGAASRDEACRCGGVDGWRYRPRDALP